MRELTLEERGALDILWNASLRVDASDAGYEAFKILRSLWLDIRRGPRLPLTPTR
jgi:hypothetical protein